MRADADQVSAEPLGLLPNRFGNIAFLDYSDLSLDSACGGVRRHLRTEALLGLGNNLDRSSLQEAGRLENVEQPHDTTWRYRAICVGNRAAAVFGEVARGEYPAESRALALDRFHARGGNADDAHRRVAQHAARN